MKGVICIPSGVCAAQLNRLYLSVWKRNTGERRKRSVLEVCDVRNAVEKVSRGLVSFQRGPAGDLVKLKGSK